MTRERIFLIGLAAAVAAADQLTKWVFLAWLTPGQVVQVIPGFANFLLALNKGAAFSSFANFSHAPLMLKIVSAVAILVAGWLMLTFQLKKSGSVALALVVGGAAGNLIDRLRLGLVVDFVDLYLGSWHWPVFNLADTAITAGGVTLAILLLRGKV